MRQKGFRTVSTTTYQASNCERRASVWKWLQMLKKIFSYLLEELEFASIVEAGLTYGLDIPE
jgi:hypothetical protein